MNKYTKKYFYYKLLFNIFSAFILDLLFISNFFEEDGSIDFPNGVLIFGIVWLILYLVFVIYDYFYVKLSEYSLNEKDIRCKRGVLFRKKSMVEYPKMHAINKRQNFLQKLFHIAVLTIDSGSTNTSFKAEIIIIEEEKVVDELIRKIKAIQNHTEDASILQDTTSVDGKIEIKPEAMPEGKPESKVNQYYEFTSKRKLLYGFLNTLGSILIIIFLTLFLGVAFIACRKIIQNSDNIFISILSYVFITYGGITILSFISSILFAFVTYYHFTIREVDGNLEVNYGLFVINQNTLNLKKIKAIEINQSFIQRLFGFVTINLEVIGYGEANNDNKQTKGILIPLCKASEVKSYLQNILPSYIPVETKEKPNHFWPFVLYPIILIFSITFYVILSISSFYYFGDFGSSVWIPIFIILGVLFIFMIIALIGMILEYHTNSLAMAEDKITIARGGWIKQTFVIQKKDLIAVERVTTPLRKKSGVYTYLIHYRTNSMRNVVTVRFLDEYLSSQIESLLKE
jgi:uncharacterized membrane protein YdbT with pleckstrin-like domain